jgi:hypothetical protein
VVVVSPVTSAAATTQVHGGREATETQRPSSSPYPAELPRCLQDLLYMFGADHDRLLPWSPAAAVPTYSSRLRPAWVFTIKYVDLAEQVCANFFLSEKHILCISRS